MKEDMKAIYLGLSLLVLMGVSSCNEFLDINPTNKATEKVVWGSPTYAEMAVNYFYADVARLGSFNDYQCAAGMTEGLTDEFKYGNMNYNAENFIPNEISYGGIVITPGYVDVYMGVWGTTYNDIRRVNESLSKLKASGFAEDIKNRLEGELRFFRAMYYFELLKRYHQAIIYTDDMSQITTDKALSSETDGWRFISEDLKFAGEHLPVNTSATGRLTSGAAYALLARAMLYCKQWTEVQGACEKIFKMGYELTPDYADAFKSDNSEAIFQYTYDAKNSVSHTFDGYYAPGGDHKVGGNTMYGAFATPTQDMVEEYELASGGKADWSAWHTKAGTTEVPPYDKLEPRFKATILYNGATWKGRTIEPYVGGTDGWCTWQVDPTTEGRTTTGYYLRKLVNENHDFKAYQESEQPWIAFRLAEVYLNYAEACYRLNNNSNAMAYINKVRERAGLPGIKGLSGDELFQALRHERKVELAYEGLYYWDLRRWELASKELTGIRRHGLKIVKKANGDFEYSYVDVDNQDLNYPAKMDRFPLPQSEIQNNSAVEQFPEWK
uniref:RagB/SusD family nutrient uptake outer membrane protein n=1 Tax=Prevotella sp. GTC17259 TaxID=3236795 RepID=A0AB33J5F6_9BACT